MKRYIGVLFILFHLQVHAQLPAVASGEIRRFENFPSQYVAPRNVDVWLPETYSPHKKYDVLYMHDGQMLFDSLQSWNGKEWGVDETLGHLMAEGKIRDCIVVAVWNNGAYRHAEYFPEKPFHTLRKKQVKEMLLSNQAIADNRLFSEGPQADRYLLFLVKELKPFIDTNFSAKRGRKHTFIAGSSMGGLISMYAICEYPGVFGGAGCMSTHWTGIFRAEDNPIPAAFMAYLGNNLPSPRSHRLYFDHGTATLDSLYAPFQRQADAILKAKGYVSGKNWMTRVFPGAAHDENAWKARLAIPVLFLLRKNE
ncbi:MAG: alpha/beta hydrolase [Lewinellaceae bacterium]|nr:alpha/beta hydrolase [Lewinellaceae bacterium]